MNFSMFSPNDKNFCQFMTPHFPKPRFVGPIPHWHAGDFFLQKWHLALGEAQPGPGTGPTWTRHGPNLDQGRAQPGPGTNLDQTRAQPGPCPGPAEFLFWGGGGRPPPHKNNQGLVSSECGGHPRILIPGSPSLPESGSTPLPLSQNKHSEGFFSGEGVAGNVSS